MANTFTNYDAARTSAIVFDGFVANSVGRSASNLAWSTRGTSGVYVPTISGVAIDDVSAILGYANKQSIANTAVLVNMNQWKGFHYVIDLDQQSTTVVDLGAQNALHEGRLLAATIDSVLFTEAAAGAATTEAATTTAAIADFFNMNEALDGLNVPVGDRAWVLGPQAYHDMLGIDSFVGANQTGRALSDQATGFKGEVLGSPVYMSQNLTAPTDGLLIYRPALALAINREIEVIVGRVPGNFGVTYEGSVKFGVKTIDGNGIVKLQIS